MTNEICRIFIVLKHKGLQAKIAMFTKDKVTEIFCMADDFCKFFDAMMAKYTPNRPTRGEYHSESTMPEAEVMLTMIPL